MQDKPNIRTEIPKRLYQIGDYSVTLLGEIASGDEREFRFIMAFVPMGRQEPSLYVCAEPTAGAGAAAGRYQLRVVNEAMSEVVDRDDRWGDLDAFAEQGLRLGSQSLGLQREQPVRLL